MARTHGVDGSTTVSLPEAEQVARLMSALATASRVRILAHLRQQPASVAELTEAVGMAQPAVSHQLRILRDLGLVVGTRQGRSTVYDVHDTHVSAVLAEALRHIEHLRTAHE
jgi:DNA-binding transcriptional ArsR family regulator